MAYAGSVLRFAVENITDGLSGIANRTDAPASAGAFSISASQVMLLAAQGKQPTRLDAEGNGDRGHR